MQRKSKASLAVDQVVDPVIDPLYTIPYSRRRFQKASYPTFETAIRPLWHITLILFVTPTDYEGSQISYEKVGHEPRLDEVSTPEPSRLTQ